MVVLLALGCSGSGEDLPSATSSRGDLEVHLQFQGELVAKNSEAIMAPDVYGRPAIEWIIEDGTRVEVGDKLVTFVTEEIQDELREAESELALALTRISQSRKKAVVDEGRAHADITGAALDLHLAELSQTDSEVVARVDRESAVVDLEKARMATAEAETALERLELNGTTERQLLALRVRKNELKVERMKRELAMTTMLAPSPGLVIVGEMWEGKWKAGKSPWSGATLIQLPDLSEMLVVGWVHEVDAPKLSVDQIATVTMDAHPNAPVAGQLTSVAQLAIARGDHDVKHFRTEFALDDTTAKMKPGMTVQVDLLTQTYPNVVKVPRDAIDHHEGQSVVWIQGLTGWSPVPIVVLAEAEKEMAVEGIEPGVVVALVDPETWTGS